MARKRVLIVEDEATLRRTLRNILEYFGYVPIEVADSTAGLAETERLRPDLLLLDIESPGLSAYEVCRRLKANAATSRIPVVFLTGWTDDRINRLASAAGAVACITKPFRLQTLVAAIEGALTSAALQKAKDNGDWT